MQVAFHIGAHCTDEDRLLRCLLKNQEALRNEGVIVPGPSRYRRLIRETLKALNGATPSQDTRDTLIDSIIDEDHPHRVVLSAENFLGFAPQVFQRGEFYPQIVARVQGLASLLPATRVEFLMSVRNPATYVPALFARTETTDLPGFLQGADPTQLRWSEVINRLRAACPDALLTVWCNEDSPLIWRDILHAMAGTTLREGELAGSQDLLAEIMSPDGFARYQRYLSTHPVKSPMQHRRVITAFLEKFALPDQIEEEIDMPGWTDSEINSITADYEADIATVSQIAGVTVLQP